jgi:hypothetical protein
MNKLSAKHESFIDLMTRSKEHARRGFELLLKRQDYPDFFDALAAKGLFDPVHNPGPIAVEDGLFRIPDWDALTYLEAIAKFAGQTGNMVLAQKVMNVVKTVSQAREPDGSIRDNYHTHRKFAEILGLVPTATVALEDIDFIPQWLNSNFDQGMVIHALDQSALASFLASTLPEDWEKACRVLSHCTAAAVEDNADRRKKRRNATNNHWLQELILHHANAFGTKIPEQAANILTERIKQSFGNGSSDWRAAIEDHPQNLSSDLGSALVSGLRDLFLSWVDHDLVKAAPYIEKLLRDDDEIVRRIGIYILGSRWSKLRSIYAAVAKPELFDDGNLHELYGLLREHFSDFTVVEKTKTINAIQHLPRHKADDRLYKRVQRNWLSAIADNGYGPADTWYQQLSEDASLGPLSERPDFHYYVESWSGPGPSPYQPQELIAFAKDRNIVQKLNAFNPPETWRGPSKRALVDVLEEAVLSEPRTFMLQLPEFLVADRAYQYAVIEGFRRLWELNSDKPAEFEWDSAWPCLFNFFDRLVTDPAFWNEEVQENQGALLIPTRNWIPPAIANLLRAGTRQDSKAYPEYLLDTAWPIIQALLKNLEAESEIDGTDAMGRSINSSRGKAIEALMSHALRKCRVSDQHSNQHADVWKKMEPTFEEELAKCQDANFEFSTLAGSYLANLDYMDHQWLKNRVRQIFPTRFPRNFACALNGLVYASATRPLYTLLLENNILDDALSQGISEERTRERIIERIALGYLWGDEELTSPRFDYIFCLDHYKEEDIIGMTSFFWSIRNQGLSKEQKDRVIQFFGFCVDWTKQLAEPPANILSTLSLLAGYIDRLTMDEATWLTMVASYVHVGYNADYFVEELDRLTVDYPAEIFAVLAKMLEAHEPTFDFEDRLKSVLSKLAANGQRQSVILLLDKLKALPGMLELYTRLTSPRRARN